MALLRFERRPGIIFMPERDHFQPSRVNLRLVVQRQVLVNFAAIRAKRASLQIHTTLLAELP